MCGRRAVVPVELMLPELQRRPRDAEYGSPEPGRSLGMGGRCLKADHAPREPLPDARVNTGRWRRNKTIVFGASPIPRGGNNGRDLCGIRGLGIGLCSGTTVSVSCSVSLFRWLWARRSLFVVRRL